MEAITYAQDDIVCSLIEAGANLNVENPEGLNVVQMINEDKQVKILQMLVEGRQNPSDLEEALLKATVLGCFEIVSFILEKDPSLLEYRNELGQTLLILAV